MYIHLDHQTRKKRFNSASVAKILFPAAVAAASRQFKSGANRVLRQNGQVFVVKVELRSLGAATKVAKSRTLQTRERERETIKSPKV
jgi:hypothetical protein